jgi:hypothetical protein
MEWGKIKRIGQPKQTIIKPKSIVTRDNRLMFEEEKRLWREINRWHWNTIKASVDRHIEALSKYQAKKPNVFVLKDPVNVIVAQLIEQNFPGECFFIIMARDPYSVIESTSRKLRTSFKELQRIELVQRATTEWIRGHQKQIENIGALERCIYFRYEDLFANRRAPTKKKIVEFVPEFEDLNFKIRMHNMTHNGEFRNFNEEQRARLQPEWIDEINKQLEKETELLKFWGYNLWTSG